MEKETSLTKAEALPVPDLSDVEKFNQLVIQRRTDNSPEVEREMIKLSRNNPEIRKRLASFTNLHKQVLENVIKKVCAGSKLAEESVMAQCEILREQLGHKEANALEKIAIEQVVVCWLNLNINENSMTEQTTNGGVEILHERIEYLSKRYNRAMLTLSKMRKMKLVIQVNNAENQIVKNA